MRRDCATRQRTGLERATALCLFLVPLIVNPWGQSPGGAIKDAAMWAAAGVLGWLLIACLRRGAFPIFLKRLYVPPVCWLCVVIISVLVAASRTVSAWAALGLLPFAVSGIAVAVSATVPSGRRRLMRAWAASASIAAVYAILQHYAMPPTIWLDQVAITRSWGTVGQPTFLGAFLAMALPFAFGALERERGRLWRMGGACFIVVGLTTTYSRAAWVAALAGVMVMFLAGRGRWSALACRRAGQALVLGIALSVTVVVTDNYRTDTSQFDRFDRFQQGTDTSVTERAMFRRIGGAAIRERPWLGWGPDAFRVVAPLYDRDRSSAPFPLAWPHGNLHNEFFTASLDGGLLGLLAWGTVLLTLTSAASDGARRTSGVRKAHMSTVYGSMVAFLVQGLATPRVPVTMLGVALSWGLIAGMTIPRRRSTAANTPMHEVWWRSAACAGRVGAVACVLLAVSLAVADTIAFQGVRAERKNSLVSAERDFRIATRFYPMEPDHRRLWGELALRRAEHSSGAERVNAARRAASAFSANVSMEPRNGFWRAGLAQALAVTDVRAARREIEIAKRFYPESARIRYADSVVSRAEGRPEAERAALHEALVRGTLEPEPYIRLAELFREDGRPDFSDSLLTRAAGIWTKREDLAPWRKRVQAKVAR